MEEEFKVIKGYENYSVSNLGNIKKTESGRLFKKYLTKDGYYEVNFSIDGKTKKIRVHRLVAQSFIPNPNNKPVVDHINGNRIDNRVENLRWATLTENNMNSKIPISNTSGTKGVNFDKESNKWRAAIRLNGKYYNLGRFENKEDAIQARIKKANELFGEFTNECEKIKEDLNELIQVKIEELDEKQKELDELKELERELDELIKRK